MATSKTLVLITGGNSGVGLELASQLMRDSAKHVLLGCRSVEKGEAAVKELESQNWPGTVEFLHMDVADEESITTAAKTVQDKHGRLDALVNNAAIGSLSGGSLGDRMMQTYRTNAVGVLLTVEIFLPLLRASKTTPRIINVSSGAGSVSKISDLKNPNLGVPALPYSASKAAMNLITASQARYYGGEGVKVFAYSPGFVVSNLGPHNNAENGAQPTAVGAAPMVAILDGERDDEHGCFLRGVGQAVW